MPARSATSKIIELAVNKALAAAGLVARTSNVFLVRITERKELAMFGCFLRISF